MGERAAEVGGDVQVHSEPGQGTDIAITWPGKAEVPRKMVDVETIKVLIVDDHPVVRDGLKNMLLAFDDLVLVGEARRPGCTGLLPPDYPRRDPDGHPHAGYGRDPGNPYNPRAISAGENYYADQLSKG